MNNISATEYTIISFLHSKLSTDPYIVDIQQNKYNSKIINYKQTFSQLFSKDAVLEYMQTIFDDFHLYLQYYADSDMTEIYGIYVFDVINRHIIFVPINDPLLYDRDGMKIYICNDILHILDSVSIIYTAKLNEQRQKSAKEVSIHPHVYNLAMFDRKLKMVATICIENVIPITSWDYDYNNNDEFINFASDTVDIHNITTICIDLAELNITTYEKKYIGTYNYSTYISIRTMANSKYINNQTIVQYDIIDHYDDIIDCTVLKSIYLISTNNQYICKALYDCGFAFK